ncbi:MAG: hypothetical protein ACRBDL_03375 [Alphaproteobacteria bacterium]
MKDWFIKRFKEPSTYIGTGILAQAVMILTKSNPEHVEVVSEVTQSVAEPLASGDYTAAATIGLTGLLGMILSEKSK